MQYDNNEEVIIQFDDYEITSFSEELEQDINNYNHAVKEYSDFLKHYGMPRRSGRYPWGSGENPYQSMGDWLSRVKQLEDAGMTDAEIAEALGIVNEKGERSSTKLRAYKTTAFDYRRQYQIDAIKSMKGDGLSNVEIAKRLGLKNESNVRMMMKESYQENRDKAAKAADALKKIIDENPGKLIDVGKNAELQLGISSTKMDVVLEMLKDQGYVVGLGRIEQATNPDNKTTLKVIGRAEDNPKSGVYNYANIRQITEYKLDENDNLKPSFVYPKSMDSSRLQIIYAEDGGTAKDGLIELRRGPKDLSLGDANYAQVRILVDDKYYLKGMAVYSDDLPDGVDVRFNSNKSAVKGMAGSLKSVEDNLKKDPNNPFGSAIKENGGQSYYIDDNGKEQLSLINKRAEESDWNEWSRELPSQFLSKQPPSLIKQQLDLTIANKKDEYDEIMTINNPIVRKKLLEDFAGDCDTQASELKAASLPGQKYQVILPVSSLRDGECYAPQYTDGTVLALIRYPHAGTFEIPVVTVNNRNEEGIKHITPAARDAIGINHRAAEQLSGADFDGDTVMAIPINKRAQIKSTAILPGLENGFDTSLAYGGVEGPDGKMYRNGIPYKLMEKKDVQKQMGIISNLITDMTVNGASEQELARAVKHSMVVIDAEKHKLDYLGSERENNIQELKKKYQQHGWDDKFGGASTLLSRAGAEVRGVPEREEGDFFTKESNHHATKVGKYDYRDDETGEILTSNKVRLLNADPNTGAKVYRETGREYYKVTYKNERGKSLTVSGFLDKDGDLAYKNDQGKVVKVTDEKVKPIKATMTKSLPTNMDLTDDARTLISPMNSTQEKLYADFANNLKAIANKARKEAIFTDENVYSPAAHKAYAEQVESINYQLREAAMNAPRERQAQIIANTAYSARIAENPGLTKEEQKKIRNQAIQRARAQVGAARVKVTISDKEWEAIQAGAISKQKLLNLMNAAGDQIRKLATPKQTVVPSTARISRMKAMSNAGYTIAEIAEALGYSTTTVNKYLGG